MNRIILLFMLIVIAVHAASGQDLAGFEVMDNNTIGLSVAQFEKWGTAVADIDRNGWPDIFTIRWASPGHSRLYLNNNGVFTDITDQTPLESIEENESHTTTVVLVDFDNDGDKDIYFGSETSVYLLQNDDNHFTDIAESVGLVAVKPGPFVANYRVRQGIWADYDLDGDLDVVIGQYNNPNLYFYKNEGGTFVNIATELGFDGIATHQGTIDIPESSRRTRHLCWVDFDLDGDPDLNVGGLIYRNDGGTFTDITESTGFNPSQIEAANWFDYDNDGDLDYFKAVVAGHLCELWENQNGVMVDVSQDVGVSMGDAYRGVTIGDYDNDGDQDIFVQNNNAEGIEVLFLNEELEGGQHVFADVARWVGLDLTGDRKGAAFLDYDMDGFLDIYIPSAQYSHIMYHNLTLATNNWVGFMLEGTESNRDAIGTLVKLYTSDKMQIRYTMAPSSWLCQDNPFVHFGIGEATAIDSVVIRWPLGRVEVLTNVAINQYHQVKEGGGTSVETYTKTAITPTGWTLQQNYPNPFNASTKIEFDLPLASQVRVEVFDVTGRLVDVLVDKRLTAGHHALTWSAHDQFGKPTPSGVYFCHLATPDFQSVIKMIYAR